MQWHDLALPMGSPDSRNFGLHVNYTLPDPKCDRPASDRQIEAVRIFYRFDFGALSEDQAHALLSSREYARLCSAAIFKTYPEALKEIMARAIAAFVLSDTRMVSFVTNWNEAAYRRGSSSPRVRGSQFFTDVEQFANYLEGMMEMSGWTVEVLKQVRLV